MKRRAFTAFAVGIWLGLASWTVVQAASPQTAPQEIVDRYCVTCHNERTKAGGLVLAKLDLAAVPDNAEIWEKVVRKLGTRAMPPQGARRPDEAEYLSLSTWLESELDRAAVGHPYAGRPLLHRLNRAEYANAIRDLLALDVDVTSLLPGDDSAYGFDNISDVLGVSPSLQERYLAAARKLSALAVGDPSSAPIAETYRVRQDLSQNEHLEGLPFGTVGGMLVRHMFPLDGEYTFQVKLQHTNFGNLRGLDYSHDVETTVDDARIHVARVGGSADLAAMFEKPQEAGSAIESRLVVRVPVKAGPRDVGVAFIQNMPIGDTRRLQPFLRSSADTLDWTGLPHIQSLTITGPFKPVGPGDTPSRRKIFVCRPASVSAELPCAQRIIAALARRAYRRPVADAELGPLVAFYQSGRRRGDFDKGIRMALEAILASPKFVFRVERDPADAVPGSNHRVSDLELAARLSFFLWSSIPDDELLRVASQGRLSQPAVLDAQARRMLADPKADALVRNFAGQWLQLRNVRSLQPNSDEFPDFDDNLRQAFVQETQLFFRSVMREDRSVLDLLTADYTFVNERLARHYGIPDVYGSQFRRVAVTDEARKGLLGQGSILALTSHAERTSPVVRGKWILENVLGTPPPPPPPDVPALKENESGRTPKTLRALMTAHRANPVCASCHKVMDPIGFALENFDAVGAWRTREAGVAIDASGELADGSHVDGVVTLRQALLKRPDVFVTTMTEKLLTYALGRGLDYRDKPTVRAIVRQAASHDHRFSNLVFGVIESTPFQMRMKPLRDSEDEPAQTVAAR